MDLQEIYNRQHRRVYRVAMLYLKNPFDAEDAVQNIFIKVMDRDVRFENEEHETAWFITTTKNYCKDCLKSFWNKRVDLGEVPERIASEKEEEALLGEIEKLPVKYREVLYLYYYEEYSVREMSELLGRKESTIQTQLATARQKLKRELEEKGVSYRWRYVTAVLIFLLVLTTAGVGINAATDGALAAAIRHSFIGEWLGLSAEEKNLYRTEQVLRTGDGLNVAGIDYIDEKLLICSTTSGVILYNREADSVISTIDLNSIHCVYFFTDTIKTCIVKDKEDVVIFNMANEQLSGDIYRYPIESTEEKSLSPKSVSHDEEVALRLYKEWKAKGKYVSPDDFLRNNKECPELFQDWADYSGSVLWENKKGEKKRSFLALVDEEFRLYTYDYGTEKVTKKKLNLNTDFSDLPWEMPEFVYTGDDPYIQPIIDYIKEKEPDRCNYDKSARRIWIPAFVIEKEAERNGEYIVIGYFFYDNYVLTGSELQSVGAGERPARFYLKKSGDTYEVDRVEWVRDGSDFVDDMKKITRGFWFLYGKMMDDRETGEKITDAREKFVRMYVENNHLDFLQIIR